MNPNTCTRCSPKSENSAEQVPPLPDSPYYQEAPTPYGPQDLYTTWCDASSNNSDCFPPEPEDTLETYMQRIIDFYSPREDVASKLIDMDQRHLAVCELLEKKREEAERLGKEENQRASPPEAQRQTPTNHNDCWALVPAPSRALVPFVPPPPPRDKYENWPPGPQTDISLIQDNPNLVEDLVKLIEFVKKRL